ncbi:hypothetical protein [Clostridium kluyveri]|uniref:Uncharacterized protein n=1 Tax=Clostridium kluyveri TaxID=1534 RepID=A0A1L5FE90_CLOKL|nr:hypothetical protein [Clostridium kluyveri]APM41315.1 hypothetical protein BS101_17235 [Clostridium kluyveri]
MLKLQWIEIFLRLIPEMFLVIWGIAIISRRSLNIKKHILLSIMLGIIVFFTRDLPIYFGVHTIIIIILTIITMVIAGIPIIASIYGTLIMSLMLSLSESVNMILLNLLNTTTTINSMNPIKKCILGIPSLVILFLIIITLNYIITRRKKLKDVSN